MLKLKLKKIKKRDPFLYKYFTVSTDDGNYWYYFRIENGKYFYLIDQTLSRLKRKIAKYKKNKTSSLYLNLDYWDHSDYIQVHLDEKEYKIIDI